MTKQEFLAASLPYGLKIQYEGILNGKEISEYNKKVSEYEKTHDVFYSEQDLIDYGINTVLPIRGLKCEKLRRITVFNSYVKYEAGLKRYKDIYNPMPILRPLSDFIGCDMDSFAFKVIHQISSFYDNGDYLKLYDKIIDIDSLPFYIVKILIANHFDICGLIEKGEAVDYHTLPDFVF